ncbi:MAG: hypothetical protein ACTSU4_11315 [Promethearchaeota archaeon]
MKAYSIAKYTTLEIVLDSQLMTAGANQARVLEKFDKHKKSLKYQLLIIKLILTGVLVILPLMPFFSYQYLFEAMKEGGLSRMSILFIGNLIFSMTFIIQFLYIFLLGLFNVSAMMSGETFRWLETLPISKDQLRKIGFMTLFRSFDLPLIAVIIVFPIIMGLRTLNLIIFISSLLISILNVMFSFSLLVIVGEKLNKIMTLGDINSKKAAFLRIFSMLGYIFISFGTAFVLQSFFMSIEVLVHADFVLLSSTWFNILMSLIPFPFSSGYFITLMSYAVEEPIELWISSLVGLFFFTIITIKIYKRALNSLKTITSHEIRASRSQRIEESKGNIVIEIELSTPIKAFLKKDLLTATRDLQTLMFLIMPLIFPFFFSVPLLMNVQNEMGEIGVISIFGILLFMSPFISLMLISGLLGMEESGTTLLAALPIYPRDQAKAKLYLMLMILTLSFSLQMVLFLFNAKLFNLLIFIPASLPLIWASILLSFMLKVQFFGKLKYKYVVEEVHPNHKILKWIGLIFFTYLFISLSALLPAFLYYTQGILLFISCLLGLGMVELGFMYLIFNRMFPKARKEKSSIK